MTTMLTAQRRIVCAAIRHADGRVICGARHLDAVMRAQIDAQAVPWGRTTSMMQGFIDNYGDFYGRGDAWIIAEAAGQIINVVSSPGRLFSENLY